MDDLPPLKEVLGNVQPSPPQPPLNNITVTAEQLTLLIESSVNSALARQDALATSNPSFDEASPREMSTVPGKAVSTSPIPSTFSPDTQINQSSTAEQLTTPSVSIPSPVRKDCNDRVPQKDHRKNKCHVAI